MKIDEYVEFLIEHNVTQSQLLLLQLVHFGRADLIKKYNAKFPSDDGSMIGKYLTNDLIDKEFIVVTPTGKLKLSEKFAQIFVNKEMAFEELFYNYPLTIKSTGHKILAPTLDKKVLINIYNDAILGSIKEHNEILLDLSFGIENNLIDISIERFIKNRFWESLRVHRIHQKEQELIHQTTDKEFIAKV